MRKYTIMLIFLAFYLAGMMQAFYDLGIWMPILTGLTASVFANWIDNKMY